MKNCNHWQHVDLWNGLCTYCQEPVEFSIKMNGETGYYEAHWVRHQCAEDPMFDPAIDGEATWLTARNLASLRHALLKDFNLGTTI